MTNRNTLAQRAASELRALFNATREEANDLDPGPERDRLRSEELRIEAALDDRLARDRKRDERARAKGAADCRSIMPGTLGYGMCTRPAAHGDEHRDGFGRPWLDTEAAA